MRNWIDEQIRKEEETFDKSPERGHEEEVVQPIKVKVDKKQKKETEVNVSSNSVKPPSKGSK